MTSFMDSSVYLEEVRKRCILDDFAGSGCLPIPEEHSTSRHRSNVFFVKFPIGSRCDPDGNATFRAANSWAQDVRHGDLRAIKKTKNDIGFVCIFFLAC